jgi:hypothetical protein
MSKQRKQGTFITQSLVPAGGAGRSSSGAVGATAYVLCSLAGLLAACGGSDPKGDGAQGESTDANSLSPGSSGAGSTGSQAAPSPPLRCGDDFELVQPLTKDADTGLTVVIGNTVFFVSEGVYRVPLGDMNPDHAQRLSPNGRFFILLDDQVGVFEGADASHVDTVALYGADGTRAATVSLPATEVNPGWTYDAARKSLIGVSSHFPVKSLVRVDLTSGQSDEVMVTPTFSHEDYDALVVTSSGVIIGDSSEDKLYRVDALTGSATEIPTGLPSFLTLDVDASNAYLSVRATQPNPGVYRQPLQGGGLATLISELDGREAPVFVTPAGTFADNRNLVTRAGDYSLFRIGPDVPAAPLELATHSCDGANSISVSQGFLYVTVAPYDGTSLLRMPLP